MIKILNNQWFVGLILLILGIMLGQIFPTRSLYSSVQYLKVWPETLGGNNGINVDNLFTLKYTAPYNEQSIMMLIDVASTKSAPIHNNLITTEGIEEINYNSKQEYFFNTTNQKRYPIAIEGRTFWITLNKIKKIPLEHVSLALEYEFGISELSMIDKIKKWFKQD